MFHLQQQPPQSTSISLTQLLSSEPLFSLILRFFGSSNILSIVCVQFYKQIVAFECNQDVFTTSQTDEEIIDCIELVIDEEEDACSHSTIVEGFGQWSWPNTPKDLVGNSSSDTVALPSLFNSNIDIVVQNNNIFAANVPLNPTVDDSSCVILPSHIMKYHHSFPHSAKLNLPRMRYPGTVVTVSCFAHLQHLIIGCIGFEPDRTVTDNDIATVIDTIGKQLISIHLIKLNAISSCCVAMITANCNQLTELVVFGCDEMRLRERNTSNIHKAFESFESNSKLPKLFLPLREVVNTTSVEEHSRSLNLLDLRFSLDLNDQILREIMSQISSIQM